MLCKVHVPPTLYYITQQKGGWIAIAIISCLAPFRRFCFEPRKPTVPKSVAKMCKN